VVVAVVVFSYDRFRAKSIKTRIETGCWKCENKQEATVLEQNPSKQGLKPAPAVAERK